MVMTNAEKQRRFRKKRIVKLAKTDKLIAFFRLFIEYNDINERLQEMYLEIYEIVNKEKL